MERPAEAAVPALDAVVLLELGSPLRPRAGNGHPTLVNADVEGVAAHARDFGRQHVPIGRLVDVNCRCPPGRTGLVAVQFLLDGEEVANRVPACERHEKIVTPCGCAPSTARGSAAHATILRLY